MVANAKTLCAALQRRGCTIVAGNLFWVVIVYCVQMHIQQNFMPNFAKAQIRKFAGFEFEPNYELLMLYFVFSSADQLDLSD